MNNPEATPRVPFSYHTFFFPFLWNDNKKSHIKEFSKCLNKEKWIEEIIDKKALSPEQSDEKYNQYHYFNPAARHIIYSEADENAVVKIYNYNLSGKEEGWLHNPKNASNKARYVITKDDRVVSLHINGIRLKLFNTGIGIMIFELENYEHDDEKSINWINDYGRRIYMPYSEHGVCSSCANSITLNFDEHVITPGMITGQPGEPFDNTRLAAPITYLLTNGDYTVTTNADQAKKEDTSFYIEPIIDDRMFVACYYVNKEFIDDITKWDGENYSYITDAKKHRTDYDGSSANRLYQLMFVDGSGITCRNRNMLEKMLKEHIYGRWIDDGTITGITEFSFITVANKHAPFLVNPFLTQYVEMVVIGLAQRATLLNFEQMISDIAIGKHDIEKIQKSYVLFQSQLLLKEVTPQQQGIELYNMLLDNLFIAEQTKEIENQINIIATQNTILNESKENLILFILALLGILEAVDVAFPWIYPGASNTIKVAVSVILGAIAFFVYSRKRRK